MFKNKAVILALSILIVVLLFLGVRAITSKKQLPKQAVAGTATNLKSVVINKEFTFPVSTSADGTQINMKFEVSSAELDNQIIIQGQNAVAAPGRLFLVVMIKISNSFSQSIQINTRDYVRLSVNGDESTWLAPDIHNDPVEVQAISTKFTRVGFAVNTTDKNFVLQIGEIKGDKQKINLKL